MSDSSRKRVLITIASGELGGGTTHVLRLLEGLDRAQFEPLLACDGEGPLAGLARERGVETATLPFLSGRLSPRLWLRLRRLVRELDVHLLHAHGSRAAFAITAALRGQSDVPFVYTEHGLATNVPRGRLLSTLAARAERRALGEARAVIALSESSRSKILELAPDVADRVRVLPHGIDRHSPGERPRRRAEVGLDESRIVVGTIARLCDAKAPDDLLRAAQLVTRERADVSFLVVGDGPLREVTERRARELSLPMRFLGERLDARAWLDAFDVFCLPSRWESSPLSILEAMAAGCAVIATRVGGIPALLEDGREGRLVPPSRPDLLAEAILSLVREPARRLELGRAARERVLAERPLCGMLRSVEEVYRGCLRLRAPDPDGSRDGTEPRDPATRSDALDALTRV